MLKFDQIARSLVAVAGTLILSTVMIVGAVGPATADRAPIVRIA